MLLNRQRVKFWQRIIFGFMAVLMAGFLIFGYSGVIQGCNGNSLNSGNSTLDSQVKAALASLKKNPNDPTALLGAAEGYQSAGYVQNGLPSPKQSNDLTRALGYYDRYLALPDSVLGAAAVGLRVKALLAEAPIYNELIDYKSAVATYKKILKLQPGYSDAYLGIASSDVAAGNTAGAIAAFTKFLKLAPHSQYAAEVKSELAQLQAAAAASPSPSATP